MKEEMEYQKIYSEKLLPTICDPATLQKNSIELSPSINATSNKMKKIKSKKLNTILKKESRATAGEQNAYRKIHRLSNVQRHKMKSLSRTKYNSAVIGVEDDEYLKNLIKVNQITVTDDLIKNIIKILNEPKELKKVRNNSTKLKFPTKFDFNSQAIRSAAENIHVFDDVTDYETKITLQNTIINKFHKEVLGGNSEFSDKE